MRRFMLPGRQRRVFYGESREEVRRKLNKAIREVDTSTFIDGRGRRSGDFLDQWLTEAVRPTVRQWTYAGHEVNVRLHIKPVPGAIKLEDLTPLDVQRWMNRKVADGLSAKSVRHSHRDMQEVSHLILRTGFPLS